MGDRSVSRMTNDSIGSITLHEYSKTEISQEYSKDELDSDLDITCSDDGSIWDPSEQDEKLFDREMKENKNISIKTKPSIKSKKKSNNTNTEQLQSPKRFKSNNTNTDQIQSPKHFNPPSSHSTPKRGNITVNDSFTVDAQSQKIIMSPNAKSTPLSPESVSNSTSQSPKPSTSFGSPKSHGSPNLLQQVTLCLDMAIKFVIDNLTNETLFKDYTPDSYQPGLEKITILTHSNTKEKRNFDKYNICL